MNCSICGAALEYVYLGEPKDQADYLWCPSCEMAYDHDGYLKPVEVVLNL